MYNVSDNFKTLIKQNGRTFKSSVIVRDTAFDNNNIVEIDIEENVNPTDSFMLGGVGSSCLTVTLTKVPESLILENAKVTGTLSLLINDSYEDVPLGKFTVDDIDKGTDSNNTVKLTCYDNMILLEQAYFSDLSYPADINDVANEICTKAGVTLASTLPHIQINKIDGYTYREAIGFIASFLGSFARFNRDGKLEITTYTDSGISLDKNDYTSSFKTNATTFAIGKLSCQVNDNTILSAGSYGNEIQFKNPIMTQDQLNSIYNALKSLNYMSYSADWRGNPALQSGDKIAITDTKGNTFNTLVMDNKFTYKGGLSGHIEAVGKTETGQNFSSSGSMSNTVDRLVTEQANIKVLLADKATIEQLNATNENVQNLVADNAKINNLIVTKANITDLNATNENVQNLQVNKANITDLQASDARINTLESQAASINSLLAGNIGVENLQVGLIQSGSALIAEGAIGSAQISDLSVVKLTAGTLDLSKGITIAGANSRLKVSGNRLQVFAAKADNSLYERVSIGDVNGDGSIYGFRVRGADGTTVLLDENGVKREGITDGSINNSKIAGDANISGTKLDINSVVTAINGGTTSIQGSKVLLNGQRLDVQFSNITTTVNQKANTTDVTNAINAIQVGGRNLVLNSTSQMSNHIYNGGTATVNFVQDSTTDSGYRYDVTITTLGSDGKFNCYFIPSYSSLYAKNSGNMYTMSFKFKSSVNRVIPLRCEANNSSTTVFSNTNYQTVVMTGASNIDYQAMYFFFNASTVQVGDVYSFCDIQFEEGNKNTTWTPAPEDTQSQIDTANSNITSIQTTVSSHTSSISALQSSITLKLDTQTFTNYQTTTNGQISSINNTLSSQSSSISVLQNQITSKVTQTDINTSINNIQVGGRNLIKNSSIGGTQTTDYYGGTNAYYKDISTNQWRIQQWTIHDVGTYSLGFWAKATTAGTLEVDLCDIGNKNFSVITSWQYFKIEGLYVNSTYLNTTYFGFIDFNGTTLGTLYLGNIKLEKGSKCTDWTPAPEDVQSQIDTTNNNLNTANTNISSLTTRISTAESSITQLQNSITLKVSASDFTSYQNTVSNNFSTTNSNVTAAQNTANTAVSNASTAQTSANNAQTTANSKAKTFTTTPTVPYSVGDLWVQGTTGDLMTCTTARSSGSYTASDWTKKVKYTDDTTANAVQSNLNTTNSNLSSLTSRVSTAESKITSDAIVNTVRTSTAYISDLGQKITTAQATTIAQTASNIKIGFNGISNKVVIDTTGITINNGGFTIKNSSGSNVLTEDASGNLSMSGVFKTFQDDGSIALEMDSTNLNFYDWGSGAGNKIGCMYSSHDTASPYAAGFVIAPNRGYKFQLAYENLEADSTGHTFTTALELNNGANDGSAGSGAIGRIDMWNAHIWNSNLEWRYQYTATIPEGSYLDCKHNLNKVPIVSYFGSLGNIILTFAYIDANTVRVYNYNTGGNGGNTWTGVIYFW